MVLPAASRIVGIYAGVRVASPIYNAILDMRRRGIGATQAISQLRSEGFRFRDRIVNQIYNEQRQIERVAPRVPFIRRDFRFTPNTTVVTNQLFSRTFKYQGEAQFRDPITGETRTMRLSFLDDANLMIEDVEDLLQGFAREVERNAEYEGIPVGSTILGISILPRLRSRVNV